MTRRDKRRRERRVARLVQLYLLIGLATWADSTRREAWRTELDRLVELLDLEPEGGVFQQLADRDASGIVWQTQERVMTRLFAHRQRAAAA